MMRQLAVIGLIFGSLAAPAAAAPTVVALDDWNESFNQSCGGWYFCDVAFAEARYGDNGSQRGFREFSIGEATAHEFSGMHDISDSPGFWDGTPRDFSLEHDASEGLLSFTFDVSAERTQTLSMDVDLSTADALLISARSGSADAVTSITDLFLNGHALPDLVGDVTKDFLAVFNVKWTSDWLLSGAFSLLGVEGAAPYAPSARFRLVEWEQDPLLDQAWTGPDDLDVSQVSPVEVPAPGGFWLFIFGALTLALVMRRESLQPAVIRG